MGNSLLLLYQFVIQQNNPMKIQKQWQRLSAFRMQVVMMISFLGMAWSCNTNTTTIPFAPVNLQVNLLQQTNLTAIGSYQSYITPNTGLEALGFGGILVVHALDDTFEAFDLACPYEAQQNIRVVVQPDLTAKCPVCGSVYRIMDGTGWPISGPSRHPLQKYHVYPNGTTLTITN
jgi:nitrite reductase/ring-hydroxylating ferredoxin subunit